jgi:hypothetical protein
MPQAGTPQTVVRVTTDQGATIVSSPAAVYRGLRDQREILGDQSRDLQEQRQQLQREYDQLSAANPGRASIEKRMSAIDARVADLDQQIAKSDQAVANAAAIPGATQEPPRQPRPGPPEEVFILSGMFMFIVFLPLSIAFARRVWRRSARAEVTLPPEMSQRMESLERGVEAIAIEVERIGEGQRFVTQALAARGDIQALGAGAADPIAIRQRERAEERR